MSGRRGKQGPCDMTPKSSAAIECRPQARSGAVRGRYGRGLGFVSSVPRAHDRQLAWIPGKAQGATGPTGKARRGRRTRRREHTRRLVHQRAGLVAFRYQPPSGIRRSSAHASRRQVSDRGSQASRCLSMEPPSGGVGSGSGAPLRRRAEGEVRQHQRRGPALCGHHRARRPAHRGPARRVRRRKIPSAARATPPRRKDVPGPPLSRIAAPSTAHNTPSAANPHAKNAGKGLPSSTLA